MPIRPGDMAFSVDIAYTCCRRFCDDKDVINWEQNSLCIHYIDSGNFSVTRSVDAAIYYNTHSYRYGVAHHLWDISFEHIDLNTGIY